MSENFSKWVACWGNATSICDQRESNYAKNLTLRYPIRMCFSGNKLRFHFSNLTGTEPVEISEAFVARHEKSLGRYSPLAITVDGRTSFSIEPGKECVTDDVAIDVSAGDIVDVSLYLKDYTQMNSATLVTGPLSYGFYSYGNFAGVEELPEKLTRKTNWFYFLNTVDIYTAERNYALVCYGDSITAQDWPDYLALRASRECFKNVSIIRRAVCGTRILRQYDCITYAAYGLKGAIRFPIEMNVAGAKAVLIQHGINDIIHPVGVEVNPFRPWSDMPNAQELIEGVRNLYIAHARKLGLQVWSGTLLPILGWRTFDANRDAIREEFNYWLRTSNEFDGCVDFEKAVCSEIKAKTHDGAFAKFKEGFDSGDHLHPSSKAYEAMAECVPAKLLSL